MLKRILLLVVGFLFLGTSISVTDATCYSSEAARASSSSKCAWEYWYYNDAKLYMSGWQYCCTYGDIPTSGWGTSTSSCRWATPYWTGLKKGFSNGATYWTYTSSSNPWKCQWTCYTWYTKSGNSCVVIPPKPKTCTGTVPYGSTIIKGSSTISDYFPYIWNSNIPRAHDSKASSIASGQAVRNALNYKYPALKNRYCNDYRASSNWSVVVWCTAQYRLTSSDLSISSGWNWIVSWTYTSNSSPKSCQWTCKSWFEREGNTCVKKECSWTIPSGEGIWTGTKIWTSSWYYTSGTPGTCQWTCMSWYTKSGNSCVKVNETCNSTEFYGTDTSECNKCINAWRVYEWKNINYLTHSFYNVGPNNNIYYRNENSLNFNYRTLQNTTTWSHSSGNLFKYSNGFTWNSGSYHTFKAWYNERFIELAPWKGFGLYDVRNWTNRDKFAFRVDFIDNYHNKGNSIWPKLTKRECVFYKPSWCGDWVVDSNEGEQCDPMAPNSGIPYYSWEAVIKTCNNLCKIEEKNITCDSLTVTPTSGDAPLDSTLVCNWTNTDWEYRIDIKDKYNNIIKTIYNNTWIYKFQNSWNYTATCFVKNTITSNACTKNIQVWEPKQASIKIEKIDINVNDLDWNIWNDTQTINIWDKSIFRIKIINDWEVALKNMHIVDALAPNCNGSFYTNVYEWLTYYQTKHPTWSDINYSMDVDELFEPDEWFYYTCVSDSISADYTNNIKIEAVSVVDDSVKVNDSDTSKVIVKEAKKCNKLEIEPNIVVISDTKEWEAKVTCEANNVNSYQILCWNGDVINGSIGTCKYDAIWTYNVVCKIDSEVWENCTKDVVVIKNPKPTIEIVKYSGNDSDLDWDKSHASSDDSQTVKTGEKAVFMIRVENTSDEDLIDVKVTDVKAPECNKIIGELEAGHSYMYDCEKSNTTSAYTNIAKVTAKGKTFGDVIEDDDDTQVKTVNPKIKIEKSPKYPFYGDGTADDDFAKLLCQLDPSSCDEQVVSKWQKAVFIINVKNTWTEDLINVVVNDPKASGCNKTIAELKVWENYSYECEKANTTEDYTNVANVTAKGKISGENPSDSDPSDVKVVEAKIKITKYSGNLNDLDWDKSDNPANDSQKVNNWDKAVFKIIVENNWTEDLENVVVSDEKASDCNKTIWFLAVWETKTYICEKSNTTENYTNVVDVTAKGKISGTNVNDTDDTKVIKKACVPEIRILKYSGNPNDLDWDKSHIEATDNTQTIAKWTEAVFIIKITNSWDEELKNVEVVDEDTSNCSRTKAEILELIKASWNMDEYLDPSESIQFTCEKSGITESYKAGDAKVKANWIYSDIEVRDENDTNVIVKNNDPKIKIEKYSANTNDLDGNVTHLPSDDNQKVKFGEQAVFAIVVENIWNEELVNVEITDVLAPNCDKTIASLKTGDIYRYECKKDNTIKNYTNKVIVNANVKNSNETVTANDISTVETEVANPEIKIEKYSFNSADLDGHLGHTEDTDDSQTITKGTKSVFQIRIENTWNEDLVDVVITDTLASECNKTIDNLAVWDYYTYECEKANITEDYTNTAEVVAKGKISWNNTPKVDDDTEIKVEDAKPEITIKKYSANPDDLDWYVGHTEDDDSQGIISWNNSIFTIRIKNTWNENLVDIVITDELASECNKTITKLEVGEIYSYECKKENTIESYTNVVKVVAKGEISWNNTDEVNDDSKVIVNSINPIVKVDIHSANNDDLDWNKSDNVVTNDTQTVKTGSGAIFKVTIKNEWTEWLKNLTINNPEAPNCNKTSAELIELIKLVENNDNILDPNEEITYNCEKDNITTDVIDGYTITVTGKWVTSDKSVTDNDDTDVKILFANINIEKYSANSEDLDSDKSDAKTNDNQKIPYNKKAVFKIIVENVWTEDLENVVVSDPLTTSCEKIFSELKIGEKQEYTCELDNILADFTNKASVIAKGKTSNIDVNDDDTSYVDVDNEGSPTTVRCNKLEVKSNDETTVVMTCGTNRDDNDNKKVDYKLDCGNGTFSSEVLGVNGTADLTCTYTTAWTYETKCLVRKTGNNTYKEPGSVCKKNITVNPTVTPAIKIWKYSANPDDLDDDKAVEPANDSQQIAKNSKAVFKIKITNTWNEELKDVVIKDLAWTMSVPQCDKTYATLAINETKEYTCEMQDILGDFTNKATVTAKGKTSNTEVTANDTTYIDVKTGGWHRHNPGPSGWSEKCDQLTITPYNTSVKVVCAWKSKDPEITKYKIDCGNGLDPIINTTWETICKYRLDTDTNPQEIRCWTKLRWYKDSTYNTNDNCAKPVTKKAATAKCWDGIVDKHLNEDCDPGASWDWSKCNKPWTAKECKVIVTTPVTPKPVSTMCWDGILWDNEECDFGPERFWLRPNWCNKTTCKIEMKTIPAGWELTINFAEVNKIVWSGKKVFPNIINKTKVCIKNTWVRTLKLENEKITLIKEDSNNVINQFIKVEKDISWFVQPGNEICSDNINTNAITTIANLWTNDYGDAKIIATVNNINEAYFAKVSNIRVAKPWVSTTGAWNTRYSSVRGSTINVASVNSNDSNFVGWNIWNTSGRNANVWTWSVNENYNRNTVDTSNTSVSWENYNWLDNVKIIEWDVTIKQSDIDTSKPMTYIVKWWNLTIDDTAIKSSNNIAFVVKWWDLIIKKLVTHLDWTYIVIRENNKWWNITWDVATEQLVVKGSLYWNVNDLVSKRTYVDWEIDGDTLSVWTILDFDSALYSEPAPLLSDFLTEYTNAARVAQ